ncbi:hypothetical protein PUN28_004745 [Cardiocondyla obscurior]|uniref:Uncharacterized protein n=1 Tax=Cardiocondyla obscurior TaxID=286306 RepID=A0AAW2GHH6_9HYME
MTKSFEAISWKAAQIRRNAPYLYHGSILPLIQYYCAKLSWLYLENIKCMSRLSIAKRTSVLSAQNVGGGCACSRERDKDIASILRDIMRPRANFPTERRARPVENHSGDAPDDAPGDGSDLVEKKKKKKNPVVQCLLDRLSCRPVFDKICSLIKDRNFLDKTRENASTRARLCVVSVTCALIEDYNTQAQASVSDSQAHGNFPNHRTKPRASHPLNHHTTSKSRAAYADTSSSDTCTYVGRKFNLFVITNATQKEIGREQPIQDESLLHEKYGLRLYNYSVLLLKTVRDAGTLNINVTLISRKCNLFLLYYIWRKKEFLSNSKLKRMKNRQKNNLAKIKIRFEQRHTFLNTCMSRMHVISNIICIIPTVIL